MSKPSGKTDDGFEYVKTYILVLEPRQTLENVAMPRGRKKGSKNSPKAGVVSNVVYAITDGASKTHITGDPVGTVQELVRNGQAFKNLTARKMDKIYTLQVRMLPKEEASKYVLPDIAIFQPAAEDKEDSKTVVGKLQQVVGDLDTTRPFYGVSEEVLGFAIQLFEPELQKKSQRGRPRKVQGTNSMAVTTSSGQ